MGSTQVVSSRGSGREDRGLTFLAWSVWAVIGLGALSVVVLLSVMQRGQGPLVGPWVGQGADGQTVSWDFRVGGSGSRIRGDTREAFRYRLVEGYPNRIVITMPAGGDHAVTYRGLVEIGSNGTMRLDLGPAGGPPPGQLGAGAIELRRPASR